MTHDLSRLRTAFELRFELASNSLRTGVFAHSPLSPLECAKHAHPVRRPGAHFAPFFLAELPPKRAARRPVQTRHPKIAGGGYDN